MYKFMSLRACIIQISVCQQVSKHENIKDVRFSSGNIVILGCKDEGKKRNMPFA